MWRKIGERFLFKYLCFQLKFISKGETIENIIKTSKGVIEGLPTLEVIYDYSKEKGLDMPITG